MTLTLTDGGICSRSAGSLARTPSTTATRLASGCFCTARMMERLPFSQEAILSFSTLSWTVAISSSFTGEPLRQATTTLL